MASSLSGTQPFIYEFSHLLVMQPLIIIAASLTSCSTRAVQDVGLCARSAVVSDAVQVIRNMTWHVPTIDDSIVVFNFRGPAKMSEVIGRNISGGLF